MGNPKNKDELARQLWAIGDITRLELLNLLPETEDCRYENNVSRLAEKLGLAQPTVSHHLRILRQAGIVKNRKMCRDVFYWIDPTAAEAVLGALRDVMQSEPPSAGAEASPKGSPGATGRPDGDRRAKGGSGKRPPSVRGRRSSPKPTGTRPVAG